MDELKDLGADRRVFIIGDQTHFLLLPTSSPSLWLLLAAAVVGGLLTLDNEVGRKEQEHQKRGGK
jgi:hypothetical protein